MKAWLVAKGQRWRATARIVVGPPDYAPGRRRFVSLADNLVDRDLPPVVVDADRLAETEDEIVGLFVRTFRVAPR